MSKLSFQDMVDIIEKMDNDPSTFVEYISQIIEFSEEVDRCASNILDRKGDDYVMMFMSVVSSFAMTTLMQEGMSAMQAMMMAKDKDIMRYTLLLLRLTIGLSVLEELR